MVKVLIISNYFKPGYRAGGPIQSVYNLCNLLSNYKEMNVLTQSNDLNSIKKYPIKEDIWHDLNGFRVKYTDSKNYNQHLIHQEIKKIKPDYIYFNSLFSLISIRYTLSSYFNKKIKIIIAPRGELDKGALSLKAFKKKLFLGIYKYVLAKDVIFHATTDEEYTNIRIFFKKQNIVTAPNVPKLILNKPNRAYKEENKSNFIFISRISPKKNLLYLIEKFQNIIIQGSVNIDVIGPIEDVKYWEEIISMTQKMPKNIKFKYLGEFSNEILIERTISHHFMIFPTLAENYGHVIYESLSYGLPVFVSNNTPWKEKESNGIIVWDLQNHEEFISKFNLLHSLSGDDYYQLSNDAFNYASELVDKNYLINSYNKLFK